jgi:hypothetical protein
MHLSEDVVRRRLIHANREFDIGVLKKSKWTSLWSRTAGMPAACYRELAYAAGVHIFNEQDDVFYANRSLICLHARSTGERVLRFPARVQLRDAMNDEQLCISSQEWKGRLKKGETRLFHWLT